MKNVFLELRLPGIEIGISTSNVQSANYWISIFDLAILNGYKSWKLTMLQIVKYEHRGLVNVVKW